MLLLKAVISFSKLHNPSKFISTIHYGDTGVGNSNPAIISIKSVVLLTQ